MNGKLPQDVFDQFVNEQDNFTESFLNRLKMTCGEHGANYEEKLAKLKTKGKVPVPAPVPQVQQTNGKLPQATFDQFVNEYSDILDVLGGDYDATMNVPTQVNFALGIDDDTNEVSIADISYDVSDALDDAGIDKFLAACPQAKTDAETFRKRMTDFSGRLKAACAQHNTSYDDKLNKIRDRAR